MKYCNKLMFYEVVRRIEKKVTNDNQPWKKYTKN